MFASVDYEVLTDEQCEEFVNEIIADCENIYTDAQLARKAREMRDRLGSREVISKYLQKVYSEDNSAVDDTFVETICGDIKDAANRDKHVSNQDFEMVCMRAKKASYAQIAVAFNIPKSTCHYRIHRSRALILKHKHLGFWEDIMDMQRCVQSNWYSMFREMIEWAEAGFPTFKKEPNYKEPNYKEPKRKRAQQKNK